MADLDSVELEESNSGAATLSAEVQPFATTPNVAERLHKRAHEIRYHHGEDVGGGILLVFAQP